MSTPTLPYLLPYFQWNQTPGAKGLHNHQVVLRSFILWSNLQHLLPSLPCHLPHRDWAHSEGTFWWTPLQHYQECAWFFRRRVFQYKRTYRSRRTGPRDQALWWEQTKEDAGDASHLSTSMLINFPLHLRLARTCKKQHSNFKFYSWYRGATRNGKHSTEERPMPEMSGNLTQTLALLFTFWMVNFDIFCQHSNVHKARAQRLQNTNITPIKRQFICSITVPCVFSLLQ